jgi:hypothetical protein
MHAYEENGVPVMEIGHSLPVFGPNAQVGSDHFWKAAKYFFSV